MTALLRLDGLHKRYGARTVLDGLSFEVARGEVFGLLGPNGCGKSTAIAIVAQLLAADAGTVEIDGHPPARASLRRVGLCPQEIALYRDLTARENLEFFGRLHGLQGVALRRRVDALVDRFALGPYAGQRLATLSGGWQQRVNIAAALVHGPDLLILDEPTSAVDLQARHALWELIGTLARQGLTLLLTTHNLDEAERLCSRVAVMQSGRVRRCGTLPELLAEVPAQAVARVESDAPAAVRARAAALGWPLRHYGGGAEWCLLPQPLPLIEVLRALDGVPVTALAVQPVRLEHAYLELLQPADAPDPGASSDPHPQAAGPALAGLQGPAAASRGRV
jgi:ABC-2 type transport system ATP-binding protein